MKETRRHLNAVHEAALGAARIQLAHYGTVKKSQISEKSKNDFVTVVDRASQDVIIGHLKKQFPSYGFKAEESGVDNMKERTWVIDPLDGTSNYIHHFPQFCISIGLMEKGVPILGGVYDPIHKEFFHAVKDGGAFLNGKKIHVSGIQNFRRAFVATGFPYRMKEYFEPYHRSLKGVFYNVAGIRRGGSAALDLCYTACGRYDGFWEFGLSLWDIAAGVVLVEEAGGAVTDFRGNSDYLDNGNVIAGSPKVHTQLVRIIKKIRGFNHKKGKAGA